MKHFHIKGMDTIKIHDGIVALGDASPSLTALKKGCRWLIYQTRKAGLNE